MKSLLSITAITTFSGIVYGSYKMAKERDSIEVIAEAGLLGGICGFIWPITGTLLLGAKLGQYIEENHGNRIDEYFHQEKKD